MGVSPTIDPDARRDRTRRQGSPATVGHGPHPFSRRRALVHIIVRWFATARPHCPEIEIRIAPRHRKRILEF
jgi:hypothetical protein